MKTNVSKSDAAQTSGGQATNQAWWQSHPMTYDWERTLSAEEGSPAWYEAMDRRFVESAYYARGADGAPFGRFLETANVRGQRVLEVGCGMGFHAELLTRSGAHFTAMDLTLRAVTSTKRRLTLSKLRVALTQADAEKMPFADRQFDVVWTWGVIHHSRSFEACLGEVARTLRPGGRLMLMVYYRDSLVYWLHCGLLRGILMGQLRRKSLPQIYVDSTDGFYARVFTKAELLGLLGQAFEVRGCHVVGLKAELFPIPRTRFKVLLESWTPDAVAKTILGRWGSMIVVEAVRR